MNQRYDDEEHFHDKDRKRYRKQRRLAQSGDLSKFKKTDQEKRKTTVGIDPSWSRGRVISITGEGAWVQIHQDLKLVSLKGLLKKEKMEAKNIIAVGDIVWVTLENAIAYIEPRYSFLARTDISGKKEQLIAVNVDQAIVVVSVVNPPLKPALVDRYLIAAEKGNIQPIIVINKIDLLDEASEDENLLYREFLAVYEKLGLPILSISTKRMIGLEALRLFLENKTTVFSGQSGVGKSSLLNGTFGLKLKTGELAQKTAKGTHTTTSAELIPLPNGGYCVDTPGIRSFGLWKLKEEEVKNHFVDFAHMGCKYLNCLHISEPECAVLKALEQGELSRLRYDSYRSLIDEARGGKDNRAKRKETDESY